MIIAEYDILRAENERYAKRLDAAGALAQQHTVEGVDHGYDVKDAVSACAMYAMIAEQVRGHTGQR